jgi:hypothetical protein
LKPIVEEANLIPSHQFGFRESHSTIDQVHRITNVVEDALEKGKIFSTVFLDVAQAFDKVWHRGLEFKLQRDLPFKYFEILKSYLAERYFRVKYGDAYSGLRKISAGVPQGSVLGPLLYLLYTNDLPVAAGATTATFADDTAILAVGSHVEEATTRLQEQVNKVSAWAKRWRITLNQSKSTHVNFSYKKGNHIPLTLNSTIIPYSSSAKYLGMTLDAKLKWKEHIKMKKRELNVKFRKMYWLLGRHSELAIHNKLLIYQQILKPCWTYGVQLWGCSKKSHLKMVQTFQNKVLRSIVNAPWFIRNDDLHRDLKMETVEEAIKRNALKHEARLQNHKNAEVQQLVRSRDSARRRLSRAKPHDLVQ